MRTLFLPAVALLAVGLANIDFHPTKTVVKTVVKTKVVTKKVNIPAERRESVDLRDGYISRRECVTLPDGSTFRYLINRFGWPAGDDSTDSYSDSYMNIPLREDHTSFCSIDLFEDELTGVQVL